MATDFHKATTLIVVRHGETIWNTEARFQGHTDIPLSERGRAQARATARRLAGVHIDAAYCSPLQRCLETTQIILQGRAIEPTAKEDLREASHGRWEGMTHIEVLERYPEDVAKKAADPANYGGTDGEPLGKVQKRVWKTIMDLVRAHPQHTLLVTSHGGPIRALICSALGLDLANSERIAVHNAAITVIKVSQEGNALLLGMNDACHLYKV